MSVPPVVELADPPARELNPPARELNPPARELNPPARELNPPVRELESPARELEPPVREAVIERAVSTQAATERAAEGRPGPPDPRVFAQNLARCVVEVLAGTRQLDQLARWLSDDVYEHLLLRDALARRARAARGESPARLALTMGSTVLSEPTAGVVDAVVIVHGRARSRAVALRLETLHARWRATAVHVL